MLWGEQKYVYVLQYLIISSIFQFLEPSIMTMVGNMLAFTTRAKNAMFWKHVAGL